MKIWLDMDGTIVDLYNVENWLEMLITENPTPYEIAKPLINLSVLAKLIHKIQNKGLEVCIVSALSKNSSPEYDKKVKIAKEKWLKKHLPSVKFDEIRFVPYDFIKNNVNGGKDLLFDDENRHLVKWTGSAFHASKIFPTLKFIIKNGTPEKLENN